jgi:hypothetical protein
MWHTSILTTLKIYFYILNIQDLFPGRGRNLPFVHVWLLLEPIKFKSVTGEVHCLTPSGIKIKNGGTLCALPLQAFHGSGAHQISMCISRW